jgi:hypothetical protein
LIVVEKTKAIGRYFLMINRLAIDFDWLRSRAFNASRSSSSRLPALVAWILSPDRHRPRAHSSRLSLQHDSSPCAILRGYCLLADFRMLRAKRLCDQSRPSHGAVQRLPQDGHSLGVYGCSFSWHRAPPIRQRHLAPLRHLDSRMLTMTLMSLNSRPSS